QVILIINYGNIQQLLFYKLQKGHLNVKDWKCLYESLSNLIIITEVCSAQDNTIDAFKQMKDGKNEDLFHITYIIQRTLDFDQAEREGRFVVKPGLDHDLDDLKRKFSGLEGIMNKVAEMELNNLPSELQNCSVAYLAHIGFLLILPPSDENLAPILF
ncbi:MutS-like protein 5, partial [Armadillidium nasatum]